VSDGSAPLAWAVTTGEAGMVSQAVGLAEATGLPVVEKRIVLRPPWRWLPGDRCPRALSGLGRAGDALMPPWPDLLITCGRRSVAPALAIRCRSGGRTRIVHVQDPRVPPAQFDLVAAPSHDGLAGPNVVTTLGALHRITPAKLAAARDPLDPRLAGLPRPLVAVLIGGNSRHVRLTPAGMARIGEQLAALARAEGAGLAVSASRRTGAAVRRVLADRLADSAAWIWDGTGANPYLAMLASADAILVTADSVSMVSEAAATGSPVHVVDVEGGHPRLAAFHAAMAAAGITRAFRGRLERWSYAPLDETARVAARVRALLPAA